MFKIFRKSGIRTLFLAVLLVNSACFGDEGLDKSKYISVDEVKPGMKAYCLTVYKGTKIEKFELEVLSVIRNNTPGRDMILVQGTDERFIHTGPVMGCSGSPVYIDGRMAGALSGGWPLSKDPLYGVTPIEYMLEVGKGGQSSAYEVGAGYAFDSSVPLDLAEIYRQVTKPQPGQMSRFGPTTLLCPLVTTGLPGGVVEQLRSTFEPLGFMPVASGTGAGQTVHDDRIELAPGSILAVPLVTGDIEIAAIGTVTEVVGNTVYGFGHKFFGFGSIDLPMATGKVHTVVSNLAFSFKLVSVLEIVGALRSDESAAVTGRLGAKAKMIPLTIRVNRYNDIEREYKCRIADNRILTPALLNPVVQGAVVMLGTIPQDNMLEYKVSIGLEGSAPIVFENVSTRLGTGEMIRESIASVALLMNNPYEKADITSLDFDISLVRKDVVSNIWSVDLSDSRVKAGEQIEVEVVLETTLSDKKKYRYILKIPDDIQAGEYDLLVGGGYAYKKFVRKASAHKFSYHDLPSLVEALNNVLAIKRDRLYFILDLPSSGIILERRELPDLPATKALILHDAKRTLKTRLYQHWVEDSLVTGTVITNKKIMKITIEK